MGTVLLDTSTGRLQNLTQEEIGRRIRCARALLAGCGLEMILVVNPACGGYRYWFTGTSGPERASEGGILIGREGDIVSVTGGQLAPRGVKLPENFSQGKVGGDCIYKGVAEVEGFYADIIEAVAFPGGKFAPCGAAGADQEETAPCGTDQEETAPCCAPCGAAGADQEETAPGQTGERRGGLRVGVVNYDWLRADLVDFLREEFPGITLVDITGELARVKAVKSGEELCGMRAVSRMMDKVFASAAVSIRPQVYERDIVNDMRYAAYQSGCGGPDYLETAKVQLVSGRDGAPAEREEPVWPGRLVTEGDRVNVRMYCMGTNSFYGMLGRSFILGEPCGQTKRMWETAKEAQRLAAAALVPGAVLGDVARQVNAYLREQGYQEDPHTFLHGLGYTVDEAPRLYDPSEELPLAEGMVIVVEPSVSDGTAEPVCCGDAFAVTADGGMRLGAFLQELICL